MTDPTPRRAAVRLLALLGLGALAVALGTGTAAPPDGPPKPTLVDGKPLFADWPKGTAPDAVLVLSGQSFGYLQPCGCSRPQLGGLERRAVFIDSLRAKGWKVAGIDLGDLTPEKAAVRDQSKLKYVATMNALREMGYVAVGVGYTDLATGLDMLLGAYAVQKERPPFTLAGNAAGLNNKGEPVPRLERFPVMPGDTRPLVGSTEVVEVGGVPVGVAGVVGTPTAVAAREKKLDTSVDFTKPQEALTAAVAELSRHPKKPRLNVLIFQGTATDAVKVAQDFPAFGIILCQSDALAPLQPRVVNGPNGARTWIVETGNKGQNVGVVGVFKTAAGYELKYQLVPLGEEFITPGTDEQALKANKTLGFLNEYAEAVKGGIRLGKDYPRTPHPAQIHAAGLKVPARLVYVGSEACAGCHAAEHAVWSKAHHSHALDTLEKYAKRPALRQFDGECVKCHSVGFDHTDGFQDAAATPHLKHVGCESCHGPGSGHAADPKNKDLAALMSLWKQGIQPAPGQALKLPDVGFMDKMAKLSLEDRGKVALAPADQLLVNRVSGFCMKCHDQDADPHFDIYKSWPKVNHAGLAPKGGWPAADPRKK